jgi:CelD/BcsL family acetyltransferase involved in cellulose biosynthesis
MAGREARAPGCGMSASEADEVRVEPLPEKRVLQAQWRELEARSRCSFFLGWGWIGAWLDLIGQRHPAQLICVYRDSRRIGMGIITAQRRLLGLGPRHLRLHETGDRALDNLTIEYNGLLCLA